MEPPPELKSVSTYLIRGKELEDKEPIVSYFCYLYATKLSISLGAKSKESQQFISSLMDKLESDKVKLSEYEAINDDDVGYAHLENFGLKIFLNADNEDRNGLASKKTVKTFVAASVFLECLKIFKDGELDEDVKQKIKYAKYKAADIMKALNEGRKPTPGPPGSEIPSATQVTPPVVEIQVPTLNTTVPTAPPVVPPKVTATAPPVSSLQIPPEFAHLPVYQPPSNVPLPKDFSSIPDEEYELEDEYTEDQRKVIIEAVDEFENKKAEKQNLEAKTENPIDSNWMVELKDILGYYKRPKSADLEYTVPSTPHFFRLKKEDQERQEKIKKLNKKDNFPPLSKEALNEVARNSAGSGLVVEAFKIDIKKEDLKTLSGRNWLNDQIINFYGELIMDRAKKDAKYPKIHIFNTFFYENLSTKGYSSVRRWSKKFDVFGLDMVIIPVHLGMHWVCSAINLKQKRVEYYDSLHGSNERCLSDIPAQHNGYDCGVFTCMFMEYLSREADFEFGQKHMEYLRKRVAHEIINTKLIASK
ncbi:hypothetical protein HDV01_002909 [Terramyces sp. JEL0728]|nr:hypothetical protein HDV01_002909 [Terramyces sp. JEL0728]